MAIQRLWRERIIEAANKAADDLRADDPIDHALMIGDLERLAADLGAPPLHQAP